MKLREIICTCQLSSRFFHFALVVIAESADYRRKSIAFLGDHFLSLNVANCALNPACRRLIELFRSVCAKRHASFSFNSRCCGWIMKSAASFTSCESRAYLRKVISSVVDSLPLSPSGSSEPQSRTGGSRAVSVRQNTNTERNSVRLFFCYQHSVFPLVSVLQFLCVAELNNAAGFLAYFGLLFASAFCFLLMLGEAFNELILFLNCQMVKRLVDGKSFLRGK